MIFRSRTWWSGVLIACLAVLVATLVRSALEPFGNFYYLPLVPAVIVTALLAQRGAVVLAIMLAVQRVGSSLAAQVGMLGPVSTIVMSLWLLDEPMGPAQIAGTVLVLIGVLLVTRLRR